MAHGATCFRVISFWIFVVRLILSTNVRAKILPVTSGINVTELDTTKGEEHKKIRSRRVDGIVDVSAGITTTTSSSPTA
jgi:hypothetical protein